MKLTVDIEGVEAVCDALHDYGDNLMPTIAKALKSSLAVVEKDAKALCPVATGELRGSIHTTVTGNATSVIGTVGTSKEYAVYVEMGTGQVGKASGGRGSAYRTGGWFVPLKRGAVMMADTEVQSASNGFWTYGQPARPYLYPAFKANRKKVIAAIRAAVRAH